MSRRPTDWGDQDSQIAIEEWERRQAENHPELWPERNQPLKKGRNVLIKAPESARERLERPTACVECGGDLRGRYNTCDDCFAKMRCPDCHKLSGDCKCWERGVWG